LQPCRRTATWERERKRGLGVGVRGWYRPNVGEVCSDIILQVSRIRFRWDYSREQRRTNLLYFSDFRVGLRVARFGCMRDGGWNVS
jgi:hypothetical protein